VSERVVRSCLEGSRSQRGAGATAPFDLLEA
jgi:hypothetical protein